MNAENKCNRCEQFGPNGLTAHPCKRIPSRNCPWFVKISEKKFRAIVEKRKDFAERMRLIREKEAWKYPYPNPMDEVSIQDILRFK